MRKWKESPIPGKIRGSEFSNSVIRGNKIKILCDL